MCACAAPVQVVNPRSVDGRVETRTTDMLLRGGQPHPAVTETNAAIQGACNGTGSVWTGSAVPHRVRLLRRVPVRIHTQ